MHVPCRFAKYALIGGNHLHGFGVLAWHDMLLDAEAEAAWLQREGCPCQVVPAPKGNLLPKDRLAVNALIEGAMRAPRSLPETTG